MLAASNPIVKGTAPLDKTLPTVFNLPNLVLGLGNFVFAGKDFFGSNTTNSLLLLNVGFFLNLSFNLFIKPLSRKSSTFLYALVKP